MTREAGFMQAEYVFSVLLMALTAISASLLLWKEKNKKTRDIILCICLGGGIAAFAAILLVQIINSFSPSGGIAGIVASVISVGIALFVLIKTARAEHIPVSWKILFVLYIAIVLYLTIFLRFQIEKQYFVFVNPIEVVRNLFSGGSGTEIVHFLKNIVMFLPLGFFLTIQSQDRYRVLKYTIVGFTFSTWIELVQLLLNKGECDIGDVLGNGLGTFCGCCFAILALRIMAKKFPYRIKKQEE